MKPYRPEILEFNSDNKRHQLYIPMPPKTPLLIWEGKDYPWPAISNAHPKLVLFNDPKQQVILLGGLGDPGVHLGDVDIYSLRGSLLKHIGFKHEIPELEAMSGQWRQLYNFPWLAAVYLSADGQSLSLWICAQLKASINLQDFTLTTEPDTDAKHWDDSCIIHGKGLGKLLGRE